MKLKSWSNHFREILQNQYDNREIDQLLYRVCDKILNYNRADLVLNSAVELPVEDLEKLNQVLEQLKLGKPFDYIFSETIFMGLEFYVDANVLIPRPETEELVLLVLENEKDKDIDLLDIGTGSGCIPIALLKERNYRQMDACEVSEKALNVARKNGQILGVDINWKLLDILTELPAKPYDVVISNPPYVKPEELKKLDKNVIEWEPKIALAPESDPLEFYKRMIDKVDKLLLPGGRFYWEIHEDLGEEVLGLLTDDQFKNTKLIEDMYGRDRFVITEYQP